MYLLVHLGLRCVSWSSKAEYQAIANGVTEACWLWQLLEELRCPLRRATIVYSPVTSKPNMLRLNYTLFEIM